MPKNVSIPQAVSTVATELLQKQRSAELEAVSIPQAVSTVATWEVTNINLYVDEGFNTASGKHCCNPDFMAGYADEKRKVSIPQAVSTVATSRS